MGRGGQQALATGGFNSVLGRGRYGARISDVEKDRRVAVAERAVWLNSPVTFWLHNPGEKKIQAIKEIRAFTHWGLKESKDFMDRAPSQLPVTGAQAESLQAAFERMNSGAVTEIRERDQLPEEMLKDLQRADEAVEVQITNIGQRKIQVIKAVRSAMGWSLYDTKHWVDKIQPGHPGMTIVAGNQADLFLPALQTAGATATSRELGPMSQVQTLRSQVIVVTPGDSIRMLKAYRTATLAELAAARAWLVRSPATIILSTPKAQSFAADLEAAGAVVKILPVP